MIDNDLLSIISQLFDNYFTTIAHQDDNKVIVSTCEVAPERIVTKHGKFWIKGQSYNLKFMLTDNPLADRVVGVTIIIS